MPTEQEQLLIIKLKDRGVTDRNVMLKALEDFRSARDKQSQVEQASGESELSFKDRMKLSTANPENRAKFLGEIGYQESRDSKGRVVLSKDGRSFLADEEGLAWGDVADVIGHIGGFARGVGKGALSTISGASELGQKVLGAPARGLQKAIGQEPQEIAALPEELTTPKTTAEKAGFATEQIAEFFIPSSKIAKTLSSFNKSRQAGKAATVLSQAVAQAGVGGGTTALQEGEVNADVAKSAAFAGGATIFASAVGSLLKGLAKRTEDLTIKLLDTSVKQTATQLKSNARAHRDLGKEMLKLLKKGEIDPSDAKLLQQTAEQQHLLMNERIGSVLDPIKSVSKSSDDFINTIRKSLASGTGLVDDEVKAIKQMNQIFKGSGKLNGQKLNKLKIKFAKLGKPGLDDNSKKRAFRRAASVVREEIESLDKTKTIKDLNENWLVWTQLEDSAIAKVASEQGIKIPSTVTQILSKFVPSAGTGAKVTNRFAEALKSATDQERQVLLRFIRILEEAEDVNNIEEDLVEQDPQL